ncbi:MAG: thermonuclease family protein [Okeania sp. SIO2D1]|nr:thermonuclease family protein [Okeania sp. SIO2D1]
MKVKPIKKDLYGFTVAELWIKWGGGWEFVPSEMTLDGHAWADEEYRDNCPQWEDIEAGQAEAKATRRGIWVSKEAVPPWEFRQKRENFTTMGESDI